MALRTSPSDRDEERYRVRESGQLTSESGQLIVEAVTVDGAPFSGTFWKG